ncbi:MAG: V-type ATPase 116kDa subunit family protein [Nitrososphaerota archaeon]
MAVVKLYRVTIIAPRNKLGSLLTSLLEFSWFHPSDREGLTQIPEIVILASKAHEVYSEAGILLGKIGPHVPSGVSLERFKAEDVFALVDELHAEVEHAGRKVQQPLDDVDKVQSMARRLQAIREVAHVLFLALRRFRFVPGLRRFVVVEGFTAREKVKELSDKLSNYYVESIPVEVTGPLEPYIPTLLSNPKFVSLFEEVTLSYGPPRYRDIDPTPLVAFVFPLLFGLIISDLGRGLMLILGSLLTRRFKQHYWSKMLIVLGLSSSLFGLVSGNFLGIKILGDQMLAAHSYYELTIEGIAFSLKLALFIGTVHLASAYLFSTVSRILSEDYSDGLLCQLPTFTLYSSSVALALAFAGSDFNPTGLLVSERPMPIVKEIFGVEIPSGPVASAASIVAAVSLFSLIFGRALLVLLRLKSPTRFLKGIGSSLFDMLLRPIEFLSNTLSYMRLGILMVLDRYLTYLVSITLNLGLIGVLPFGVLNIAVTALEGLMVYIQDLRLHIYEWIPKTYLLGTPFKPLLTEATIYQISFAATEKIGRAQSSRSQSSSQTGQTHHRIHHNLP